MKIVTYTDEYRQRWRDFVANTESATVAHQIEWRGIIQSSLGHSPHYLLAVRENEVVGVLPLFVATTWWRTRYVVSIPWLDYGGICTEDTQAENDLRQAAQKLGEKVGGEFVELRSVKASSEQTSRRKDKVTFLMDMSVGEEALWKGMNGKLRNQVRKSQKSDLDCLFGGVELVNDFYKVFSRNMRDLGTPVWGISLFKLILEEFTDSARIVLVKDRHRTIAGGLVLSFKDRLYVPSASALRQARPMCPNHALYWAVISKGCRDGYRWFDFGRSTIDSPTFRFKQQWVTAATPLEWQYCLLKAKEMPAINPANPRYRLAVDIWRRLPLSLANLLGPRVVRNFP